MFYLDGKNPHISGKIKEIETKIKLLGDVCAAIMGFVAYYYIDYFCKSSGTPDWIAWIFGVIAFVVTSNFIRSIFNYSKITNYEISHSSDTSKISSDLLHSLCEINETQHTVRGTIETIEENQRYFFRDLLLIMSDIKKYTESQSHGYGYELDKISVNQNEFFEKIISLLSKQLDHCGSLDYSLQESRNYLSEIKSELEIVTEKFGPQFGHG